MALLGGSALHPLSYYVWHERGKKAGSSMTGILIPEEIRLGGIHPPRALAGGIREGKWQIHGKTCGGKYRLHSNYDIHIDSKEVPNSL